MKLKYIKSEGTFHSQNIKFEPQDILEVSKEVGEYLTKTFGKWFEVIGAAKKPSKRVPRESKIQKESDTVTE